MKVTLEQNQLILSIAKQIPCKTLKKASKDTPCGLKGCDRCARWYLERALGLKLEIIPDEPPQEPCAVCRHYKFNSVSCEPRKNIGMNVNSGKVLLFKEIRYCPNCGAKIKREDNHT